MKKLCILFSIMLLLYFILEVIVNHLNPGHVINYSLNDFQVKEEYINNQKGEIKSYNFIIKDENSEFYLQIFENFNNSKKIIKEIKSFKNKDVVCILPLFNNGKALTDLMCLNNNIIYNYKDLLYENSELTEFYDSLDNYFPKENLDNKTSIENITLYRDNIEPNYYISFTTYKGFISTNSFNKTLQVKNIFNSDVYDHYLSSYVNEYYVTVNYDEKYGYSRIYIYNIKNNKENEIVLSKNIEKNSYIQGILDNSLYIFDRDNRRQLEINTETKTISEVGNNKSGIKIYRDDHFDIVSAYECTINDILFEKSNDDLDNYYYIGSNGLSKTGYTYYYQNEGSFYKIYRANNSHKEQLTYLFKVNNIDKMQIINEYIYFVSDDYLKYYSDKTGIRTLVYNNEFYFNPNIKYKIIYKNS